MAKLKITATDTSGQIHDRYTGPESINGAFVGGTGGKNNQAGRQIQANVKVGSNSATTGNIIAQKGSHKFRVTDNANPNNAGTCTLVNLGTPTASNTMSIKLTLSNITGVSLAAANVVGNATSTTVSWTSGLVGPLAPRVGDLISGIVAGNVSPTAAVVTSVVSSTSVTISTTGNVASQSSISASAYTFASKIGNRYVWDWTSDGQPDSTNGSTTFYTNGYNPTRFRYHLATPDSTFIQVAYA